MSLNAALADRALICVAGSVPHMPRLRRPSSGLFDRHVAFDPHVAATRQRLSAPTDRWRRSRRQGRLRSLLVGLGWLAACSPHAVADVLLVGPRRALQAPSDAAAVAKDGDVVRIDPGDYVDCAIWSASNLVLEAADGEAHVRDRACAGKAIWVIAGDDVTVANITFSGARVPDENGAGIRAEGRNLTVRNARFYDNENGILAAAVEGSTILIERSLFERNGKCAANCAHGIYVNRIDRLKIVDSAFREQQVGHHIKSGALALEVTGSTIEDGPDGTASYLIDVIAGGEVVIADNVMEKGPKSENWGTAIHIAGEAATPDAPAYRISGNRFRSDNPHEVAFVRNRTVVPAVLESNRIEGNVDPLVGPGTVDSGGKPGVSAVLGDRSGEQPVTTAGEEPAAGPAAFDELEAKLRFLKRLFEEELITEEEYTAKKEQLLRGL
jgi:Right handed beta helix region